MRISRANLPKISRFHNIPGSSTNPPHFLKIFLISLGFAYDFAFCQNNGLSRIIPWKNTQNPINRQDFLRRIPQIWYKKYGGLIGPKNVEILEFQKVEISKIQMFQGCSSIFSCIFWSKFMRNTGFKGPLRVQKIENFGSSQNHPKSIGIWPGTLISHFGIIKTPKWH